MPKKPKGMEVFDASYHEDPPKKRPGLVRREQELVRAREVEARSQHIHPMVQDYIREGPEVSLAHDRVRNAAAEKRRQAERALERQRAVAKRKLE